MESRKRLVGFALALIIPGVAVWSCASPTDLGETPGQGGSGGAGSGEGGGGGSSSSATSTSSSSSSTTTSSTTTTTTSSSTTTTSTSTGGGMPCADDFTCLLGCFPMGLCGVCAGGFCQCVPIDQCLDGGGLDASFPDVDLDAAFPDVDFDAGFPDVMP